MSIWNSIAEAGNAEESTEAILKEIKKGGKEKKEAAERQEIREAIGTYPVTEEQAKSIEDRWVWWTMVFDPTKARKKQKSGVAYEDEFDVSGDETTADIYFTKIVKMPSRVTRFKINIGRIAAYNGEADFYPTPREEKIEVYDKGR
ncbi:MAG: hypothetical protein ISS36_04095 [Candidatus Aenigmarchaeota archaeon]|nr:hypothetical protein [Candidatus Aenigmarchaeota archaeon]